MEVSCSEDNILDVALDQKCPTEGK